MHRWLLGALSGLSILFVGGCVNATATKGASAWNSATLGDGVYQNSMHSKASFPKRRAPFYAASRWMNDRL